MTHKVWNIDHFDHYRPYISDDGEFGYAIYKCEQGEAHENNATGFSHSLPFETMVDGRIAMNGYVPELTRLEKLQNEKVAIKDILSDDPKNQYWLDRLSAVEAQLEAERGRELFRSESELGEPTPFISGGEVTYREPYRPASEGDEEIPY